tara:strand:+ start:67 stop:321 length:255 start_codon:yes stop_codon:yes gene_type:complete
MTKKLNGIVNNGNIVINVLPENHQPIMVIATKVAINICIIIKLKTRRCRAFPRIVRANPGITKRRIGAHLAIPKCLSINNPHNL